MTRGLLIGFLAGALLAGIAFKLLQARNGAGEPVPTPVPEAGSSGGKAGAGTGAASTPADLTAARAEVETLRGRVRELEAQLEEAQKAGGTAKSKVNRAAKWRELTGLIAQAKRDADASGTPIKGDKYFGPLLALIGLVADDMGLPIQEAMMSPDWYPAFAQSMLDASPYPMTEEQRKAFDAALVGSREAWDKYVAGRENLSPLERAKALRELQFDMFGKLTPLGTPEQTAYMASLNLPPPNAPYQGVWDGAGPREAVKANISTNMAKSLGLDGGQVTSLGPVIDDYMRSYDAVQKEAAIRKKAGEPYDDVAAKLAIAMEMQKRVGETVRLTDAQAKALKEWSQVHDYQVKE
ncbi:MAG: hypothetical protein K8T20_17200 [Planctomycetes bacterium]|nr:hypothetical protein [Planctomycetota bacterium]